MIEDILEPENLAQAWKRVKANKGAPGYRRHDRRGGLPALRAGTLAEETLHCDQGRKLPARACQTGVDSRSPTGRNARWESRTAWIA